MKKQLRPKIRTDGRMAKKIIDYDEDLNYICKRLSNPMQQIPFFVILFSLPLVNSIARKFDSFGGSEILFNCLIRLADISSNLKVSGSGIFEIESLRESFLFFKKSTCSEVLYIFQF